uniref:Uncharacterized protein n=1 Tax=Physcomitrium patens TaxID=3218 RepID=A0A7I4BSY9_PHYPA
MQHHIICHEYNTISQINYSNSKNYFQMLYKCVNIQVYIEIIQ